MDIGKDKGIGKAQQAKATDSAKKAQKAADSGKKASKGSGKTGANAVAQSLAAQARLQKGSNQPADVRDIQALLSSKKVQQDAELVKVLTEALKNAAKTSKDETAAGIRAQEFIQEQRTLESDRGLQGLANNLASDNAALAEQIADLIDEAVPAKNDADANKSAQQLAQIAAFNMQRGKIMSSKGQTANIDHLSSLFADDIGKRAA